MAEAPPNVFAEGARTAMGRLVLLCTRAGLVDDEEALCDLKGVLSDETLPWESVVSTLTGQGLSLILRELVRQAGLEALLPEAVRNQLSAQYSRNAYEALFCEAALRPIAAECASADIELMVLKGLFLSRVVYEVDDVRLTGDIDLLVRRESTAQFREILAGLGYVEYNRPFRLIWERETEYLTFRGGGTPEISLDVHTLVVPEERFRVWQRREVIEPAVWRDSMPASLLGASVREMRPEHLVIYLSLHATVRHTFARAFWLVDLRETLNHYRGALDFDALCACAREWRLATFVYFALLAAQRYARADVPASALHQLRPKYRGARDFERLLLAGEAMNTLQEMPVPEAERQMARLRDTWGARVLAEMTQPYHDARRAFRHWRPWVNLKRRHEEQALGRAGASAVGRVTSSTSTSVAHVLWSGGVGGAERAVYQLVRAQLNDPDLKPAVVFGSGGGPYALALLDSGCEVIDARFRWGGDPAGMIRLCKALRRYDIHHFHTPQPAMVVASLLAGRKTRVYTHRGGAFNYDLRRRAREAIMGVMLRRGFDAYSGNTLHAARVAAARHGIAPERFSLTYNGLEFALLEPRRTSSEVRQELSLPAEATVVGTAANLRSIKRIDRLVDALVSLRDDGVWLLILGDGPAGADLQAQAERLGVADRVCFAGVRERVGDYLAAMDVFVLPTGPEESFGNAAVEAMALGVPTVVFADGGGLIEHVESGVSGFVVRDSAELVAVLRRLSQDSGLRREVGERALKAVRARYTTAASANAYKQLYAQALGHKGRQLARSAQRSGVPSGDSPGMLAHVREGRRE